jgi:hypothetical protein
MAQSIPHFEELAGVVDGVNQVFTASTEYRPGTIAVLVRGILRKQSDADGWTELDPVAGTVTLTTAPEAGHEVAAFWLEPAATVPETEILGIDGQVELLGLSGTVERFELSGTLELLELSGTVPELELDGSVELSQLQGELGC